MKTKHKRNLSRQKRRRNMLPEDQATLAALPPAPLPPEDEAAIVRYCDAMLAEQKKEQRKP